MRSRKNVKDSVGNELYGLVRFIIFFPALYPGRFISKRLQINNNDLQAEKCAWWLKEAEFEQQHPTKHSPISEPRATNFMYSRIADKTVSIGSLN